MRKHIALGTILALGLGGQAFAADGFSYNNVEAAYVNTEIGSLDGDGFALSGQAAFGEHIFGFASINDIGYDLGVDSNWVTVGVGLNWALNPDLDLVSGLSYEHGKVKIAGVGASDDGFGLGVGLRGRVAERFELTGGVKYVDLGGGADDFTLAAGARYYFTDAFAAGLDVSDNDDGTSFAFVLRYDFGNGN